ncbi:MAG: hotdog fold thioesterase [Chloroflexota bacterium]
MKIFQQNDLNTLNQMHEENLPSFLGIEFVEIGDDFVTARMPVNARVHQPMGQLHGGASVVLAETVGSVASFLAVAENGEGAVGLEVNANHLRPISSGFVYATARPLHLGRRTHVWEIRIVDEADQLICISRLTTMIISRS